MLREKEELMVRLQEYEQKTQKAEKGTTVLTSFSQLLEAKFVSSFATALCLQVRILTRVFI